MIIIEILYKITNKINNKYYIGSTSEYNKRMQTHILIGIKEEGNSNKVSDKQDLYHDLDKYGLESFDFEILATSKDKVVISRLESKFIRENYNDKLSYNISKGASGRRVLYKEDVEFIRELYNERKLTIDEAYNKYYKGIITHRAFKKAWFGDTFKDVKYEVYNDENKAWHFAQGQSRKGEQNGSSKYTEKEVISIRNRRDNGEKLNDVWKDYKDKSLKVTFRDIWNNKSWKYLVP